MRKITWLILGFMVFCLNCVLSAQAASFDCAKAVTKMEKLICSDEQLSKMDGDLSVAYLKSLHEASDPAIIKKRQREWLADVRVRCNDAECLQRAYTARIAQLAPSTTLNAASKSPVIVKTPQKDVQPAKIKDGWDAPTVIGNVSDVEAEAYPKIYFDSKGNATVPWSVYKPKTVPQAYVNRYQATEMSWGFAGLLLPKEEQGTDGLEMAIAPNGNSAVVWFRGKLWPEPSEQNPYMDWHRSDLLWTAQYDAASDNWDAAKLLDSPAGWVRIAIDPKGDTFALWGQNTGVHYSIHCNRYDAAAKEWGKSSVVIDEGEMGSASDMQFVFDTKGNAIALWSLYDVNDDRKTSIRSSRYDVASRTWSKPVKISGPGAMDPQIAMDSKGNAIAVWGGSPNRRYGYYSVWANHYDAAKGWGKQRLIDVSTTASVEELEKQAMEEDLDYVYGNNFYPKIAMDTTGNAIVVWHREGKHFTNTWARRYDEKAKTWQKQIMLDDREWGVNTSHPEIAMDSKGNAIVVWPLAYRDEEVNEGDYAYPSKIAYKRYDAANGWGQLGLIGQKAEHVSVDHPQVAMDIKGNAIAVWQQKSEGQSNIMASYFKVP